MIAAGELRKRLQLHASRSCFSLEAPSSLIAEIYTLEASKAVSVAYSDIFRSRVDDRLSAVRKPDAAREECLQWYEDLVTSALAQLRPELAPLPSLPSQVKKLVLDSQDDGDRKRSLSAASEDLASERPQMSKKLRFNYARPPKAFTMPRVVQQVKTILADQEHRHDEIDETTSWSSLKLSQRHRSPGPEIGDEVGKASVETPTALPRSPVSNGAPMIVSQRVKRQRQPLLLRLQPRQIEMSTIVRPPTPQSEVACQGGRESPVEDRPSSLDPTMRGFSGPARRRKKTFALMTPNLVTKAEQVESAIDGSDTATGSPEETNGWATARGKMLDIKRDPELAREWTVTSAPSQGTSAPHLPAGPDSGFQALNAAVKRSNMALDDLTSSVKVFEAAIKVVEKDDGSRLEALTGKWRQISRDALTELLDHSYSMIDKESFDLGSSIPSQSRIEHDEFEPTREELLAMGADPASHASGAGMSMSKLMHRLGINPELLGGWNVHSGQWA